MYMDPFREESLIIMHEFDVFYAISGRGEQKKTHPAVALQFRIFPSLTFFWWLLATFEESLFRFHAGYLACRPRLSTQVVNIP